MMSFYILTNSSKVKLFRHMLNGICTFVWSDVNTCFLVIDWISTLIRLRYHLDAVSIWRETITARWLESLLISSRIKCDGCCSSLLWWDRWLLILLVAIIIKAFRWIDIWIIYSVEVISGTGINTSIEIFVSSPVYFFNRLCKSWSGLVLVLIGVHS
jgi:hypothetical protein